MEKLLNENELAELLGIKVMTLQGWRSSGEGPPYKKVGRLVRYKTSEVEKWLIGRTVERGKPKTA